MMTNDKQKSFKESEDNTEEEYEEEELDEDDDEGEYIEEGKEDTIKEKTFNKKDKNNEDFIIIKSAEVVQDGFIQVVVSSKLIGVVGKKYSKIKLN